MSICLPNFVFLCHLNLWCWKDFGSWLLLNHPQILLSFYPRFTSFAIVCIMENLILNKFNSFHTDRLNFIMVCGKGQQDMLPVSLTAEVPVLYQHFHWTYRICVCKQRMEKGGIFTLISEVATLSFCCYLLLNSFREIEVHCGGSQGSFFSLGIFHQLCCILCKIVIAL